MHPACMNLYNLLSQLWRFIKVLKDSIKDGADRIENLCSIDVTHWKKKGDNCLQPDSMNLYHLLSQLRQFLKVLKNSILDGAD